MKYNQILARRQVRYAIVAYCHELFLNCTVEKTYFWGNKLDARCPEAQHIIRLARTKLGYKKSHNDGDIFWTMQCTWRKMIELKILDAYRPENIKNLDQSLATMHIRQLYNSNTGQYEDRVIKSK